jgi:hypothetical protein
MMSTPSLGFAGGVARSFWFNFNRIRTSFDPGRQDPLTPAAGPPVLISDCCHDESVGSKVDRCAPGGEAAERDVQALTTHGGIPLKRTLSATSLVALGIGAIVVVVIFVLTGHAAAVNAGPANGLSSPARLQACVTQKWPRRCRSPHMPWARRRSRSIVVTYGVRKRG